ncbi:MAG TPA: class I SAM-dependent methyltransferase [Acidimicrobiales bacterium]|nr:class I SAM-dependent methyltransferase [Acidimicrobiales bacterium]
MADALPSDDRATAEHFGAIAERYDAARPDYAPDLLTAVGAGKGVRALDVGCGTGQLARQLLAAGCTVVGVEPDGRMAAVARRRGVSVEVAPFETWAAAGRTFDLVVAGSAWHWVDPVAGAGKAAEVLRPGGRLAALWTEYRHHHDPLVAMLDAYRRHAPGLASFALGFDRLPTPGGDPWAQALADGPFDGVRPGMRTCAYRTQQWTPDRWVALLETFSDHRGLPGATRAALLAEVGERLRALGPTFPVTLVTAAIVATRR